MADGHGGARPGAGRPRGSPNKTPSKSALAQARFAALVEPDLEVYYGVLRGIAMDSHAPHAARIAAVREILDRSMGKPKEVLEIDHGQQDVTAAELLAAWNSGGATGGEEPRRRRKRGQTEQQEAEPTE